MLHVKPSPKTSLLQAEIDKFVQMRPRQLTNGMEIVSNRQIAPPIGYKKQPSMADIVRDMIRGERLKQELMASGAETFEEADDFDIPDDDYDPRSPYEQWETNFDPEPPSEGNGPPTETPTEIKDITPPSTT